MDAQQENKLKQDARQPHQMVSETGPELRCVFCLLTALGVFVVLAVASCTNGQDFHYLCWRITELISLDRLSLVSWLFARSWFGHFFGYATLAVVLFTVFSFYLTTRQKPLFVALLAGLFGLLMELVQVFIPSRGASLMDFGVDIIGVAVGLGVCLLNQFIQDRFNKNVGP